MLRYVERSVVCAAAVGARPRPSVEARRRRFVLVEFRRLQAPAVAHTTGVTAFVGNGAAGRTGMLA